MRATFALLADTRTANFVRKIAWGVHVRHGTGLRAARVPPHVSLKQPFRIDELFLLDEFMTEFARGMPPIEVRLPRFAVAPTPSGDGVLWIDVAENSRLRRLHDLLHEALTRRFGDVHADFDGAPYKFHMTVAVGGPPVERYQQILAELPPVRMRCRLSRLALFVYDEPFGESGDFLAY
ncbi:MAG: 2'-5' RNA ligase family protein, partial [Planctomycetota bacterium]